MPPGPEGSLHPALPGSSGTLGDRKEVLEKAERGFEVKILRMPSVG